MDEFSLVSEVWLLVWSIDEVCLCETSPCTSDQKMLKWVISEGNGKLLLLSFRFKDSLRFGTQLQNLVCLCLEKYNGKHKLMVCMSPVGEIVVYVEYTKKGKSITVVTLAKKTKSWTQPTETLQKMTKNKDGFIIQKGTISEPNLNICTAVLKI